MESLENIQRHKEGIRDNILKSFDIDIEKSRSGVYADTSENRKLNRVGQQYGSKKQEESNGNKTSKNGDNSSKNSKSIKEHAKNTSDEVLKKVLANENTPEDLKNEAKNELARRQGSPDTKSNKKIPKIGEEHPNGKFVWGKLKSGKEDWVLKEGGDDSKKTAVSSLKKMLEDESFASNFAEYEKWGDEAEIDEGDKKEFEDIKKHFNWNYGKSFDWGEEEEAEMYKNKQKSKGFIVVDSGGGTDTYSFLLFKKKIKK